MKPKLVSACLLGIKTAYDGKDRYKNEKVIELLGKEILIPVCPEQLGGLTTPRAPLNIERGTGKDVLEGKAKVINKDGEDVSKALVRGAEEVLRIAKLFGVKEWIAKSGSPSCGCGEIYDKEKKLIEGDGVTVALLKMEGIKVISEKEKEFATRRERRGKTGRFKKKKLIEVYEMPNRDGTGPRSGSRGPRDGRGRGRGRAGGKGVGRKKGGKKGKC